MYNLPPIGIDSHSIGVSNMIDIQNLNRNTFKNFLYIIHFIRQQRLSIIKYFSIQIYLFRMDNTL